MIEKKGHDCSVDIWSIGVLIFELLTGNPPFEGGRDHKKLYENIIHIKINYPKDFPLLAKDLISHILKYDPI